MKVSVIIPSYNHRPFIEETISSVLSQDYPDFELIVIDDGSKDGSAELLMDLAAKFNFKLVTKENEGICATLNRGIELSCGDFITFIASDDSMTAGRLKEQVEFLETHPDVDVVAGAVRMIDVEGKYLSTKKPKILGSLSFGQIINRNQVFAPTAMIRRRVYDKYGKYNPKYLHEDYYLWLKVSANEGRIFNSENVWANYRINEGNFEKRFVWYYEGNKQALTEYLPDPRVVERLQKYEFIFCMKMTLLIGARAFKKYKCVDSLPVGQRILVCLISLLPTILRHKLLHLLLKNY